MCRELDKNIQILRNSLSSYTQVLIVVIIFLVAGCATPSRGGKDIVNRTGKKTGEVLSSLAIGGQLYFILRKDEPATFDSSKLGVADSEIPIELIKRQYEYELIRKGTMIGITGIFPTRANVQRSSYEKIFGTLTVIIPRRHVERFISSGQEKATFKLSDP